MTYFAYLDNYWLPTKAFSFITRLVRTASPVNGKNKNSELCAECY